MTGSAVRCSLEHERSGTFHSQLSGSVFYRGLPGGYGFGSDVSEGGRMTGSAVKCSLEHERSGTFCCRLSGSVFYRGLPGGQGFALDGIEGGRMTGSAVRCSLEHERRWTFCFSIERQRLLEGVARGRWLRARRDNRRADSQKIILFVTAIATAILIDFEAVLDRKSIKKSFKMHCESMIRFTMKILKKPNKIQCFLMNGTSTHMQKLIDIYIESRLVSLQLSASIFF